MMQYNILNQLLIEGRRSAMVLGRRYEIPNDIVQELIKLDPSENKKYSDTLVRFYKVEKASGGRLLIYDYPWYSVGYELTSFHEHNGKEYKKDFSEFKTAEEFLEFMKTAPTISKRKYKLVSKDPNSVKKVFENDKVLVVRPLTRDASCIYGTGTTWCISAKDNNQFNHYGADNTIYFVLNKEIKDRTQPYHKIAVLVDKTRRWDVYDVHDEPFGYSREDDDYRGTDRFDELQKYLDDMGIPDTIFRYIVPSELETYIRRNNLKKIHNNMYDGEEMHISGKYGLPPKEIILNKFDLVSIDDMEGMTMEELSPLLPKHIITLVIADNDSKIKDLSSLSNIDIRDLMIRINEMPINIPSSVKSVTISGGYHSKPRVSDLNLQTNTNIESVSIRSSDIDTLSNINKNVKNIYIVQSTVLNLDFSMFSNLEILSLINITNLLDFKKLKVPTNVKLYINNSKISNFNEVANLPINALEVIGSRIDTYSSEFIKHIPTTDIHNNKYEIADFGGKYDMDDIEITDTTNYKNIGDVSRVIITLTRPRDLSILNLKKCSTLSINDINIFNQCNTTIEVSSVITLTKFKGNKLDLSKIKMSPEATFQMYSSESDELKEIIGVEKLHALEFVYCRNMKMNTSILNGITIDKIRFYSMGPVVWDYIDVNWNLIGMSRFNVNTPDAELSTVCSQVKSCQN